MTKFDVVLRGYDRVAVDALVEAVDAAAGDRHRIDAAVAERGRPPVVLRGYDRAQVDAWLARHPAAKPCTGEASSSASQGPELVIVLRGGLGTTESLRQHLHRRTGLTPTAYRAAFSQSPR
jgi:hypothetical protein